MHIGFLLSGVIVGLTVFVVAFYLFYFGKYFEIDNWESAIGITVIVFSVIIGIFDFVAFLIVLMEEPHESFFLGVIVGIIISTCYVLYMLFSAKGAYIRINKKIDKIDKNISELNTWNMTDKQSQAVKILRNTKEKLKEQANDILIMDSIKIAKNIELTNKRFNIQTELDELEALQILNR